MAALLVACRFTPTAGGTTDWTFSAAVTGYQSPASAGAVNGRVYKYRAERSDLSQWEVGEGAYSSAGAGVFARTTVLFNSLGTTAKINFTVVPQVAIVALKSDLLSIEEANNFTANQKSQIRANMGIVKKNYIINGAMMISQENASNPVSAANSFPVDKWQLINSNSGGVYSAARVNATTPAGSPNRLRATVTTAHTPVAAGEFAFFRHVLEGVQIADLLSGTSSSKTINISFGCKAPAGTYCIALRNILVNRSYIAEYTISGGEANTDVAKSVVLRLDQTGTWDTSNGAGIYLDFILVAGSSFQTTGGVWAAGGFNSTSNQTNFYATLGNIFELYDVGFYEGSVVPSFQVPDWPTELRACQRYYEQIGMTMTENSVPFKDTPHFYYNTSWYKVSKRASPTIIALNSTNGATVGIVAYAPLDGMRQISDSTGAIDSLFSIDARQ